jgi:hypothetical protein
MRATVIVLGLLVSVSGSAFAQEWAEYQNIQDGFKVDFPGQPKVAPITWKSEHNFMLPARVYSVDRGKEHYAVTVADYSGIEQMGIERAKSCPPGAEPCLGSDLAGIGYWKHDVRGAVLYATARMLKANVTLSELTWQQEDLVEGGGQGRQRHPLPQYLQQRVPRPGEVSGSTPRRSRRRSAIDARRDTTGRH